MEETALVWFRRDLRLNDHAALTLALSHARRLWCVFVFDRQILDPLRQGCDANALQPDRRVAFIHGAVTALHRTLQALGGGLIIRHEAAPIAIVALAEQLKVKLVIAAHDFEPDAMARDDVVAEALGRTGCRFVTCKDHVIFEKRQVMTASDRPFSVFTPYKNAWLRAFDPDVAAPLGGALTKASLMPLPAQEHLPSLDELRFCDATPDLASLGVTPSEDGAKQLLASFEDRIDRYADARDFPAIKGPSYLSVHLRFGTLSIRAAVRAALRTTSDTTAPTTHPPSEGRTTWLSELVWRDFYQMILYHHPHVVGHAFKPNFDQLAWANDDEAFAAWCDGRTGYPLVDAAMAQINRTGYMHNRLRMVTASFLVKDLGIDWRRGERYFARALIDFDLAANNGGWQWAASTGCDAQPYFRIFNPITQSQKFDAEGKFIRRYLPQLAGFTDKEIHAPWLTSVARQQAAGCLIGRHYPAPIVDHAHARAQTLARFAALSPTP